MKQTSHRRFVDRVRHHGSAEIDALLDWCEENAQTEPGQVLAVGLAYVHQLNEHQIAAARVISRDRPVIIEFPDARRRAEIALAACAPLVLDEPYWLAEAAALLTARTEQIVDRDLLYRGGRRLDIPLSPAYIRNLVGAAGRAACATRISCKTLNQSRVAALQAAGLVFALFGTGHANSWAARLAAAELILRRPRRMA